MKYNIEEVSEQLLDLEQGKELIFDIDANLIEGLEYSFFKKESLEIILKSCINDNTDIVNQINVDKILDRHVKEVFTYTQIMQNAIKNVLGEYNYDLLNRLKLYWKIDYVKNLLIIEKSRGV